MRLFERAPEFLAQQQNLSFDGRRAERRDARPAGADGLSAAAQRSPPLCAAGATGTYRALRGEQARANLTELLPSIIDQFSRAENPDAAFAAFDRFLAGLRAGGRFFSLLRQNPELIRFVALILGAAPRLADISGAQSPSHRSAGRPELLRLAARREAAGGELARALAETRGYEDVLDAIRLFGQEHMFLIGARILSGSVTAEQAGESIRAACRCAAARGPRHGWRPISSPPMAASAAARARSSRSAGSAPGR